MFRFYYESADGLYSVPLDGPITYSGIAAEVRSREWAHTLGARDIYNVNRIARTAQLEMTTSFEQADYMRNVFDADISDGTPGRFVIDDVWSQKGYVVSQSLEALFDKRIQATLTLVLLDGFWWNLEHIEFLPVVDESDSYPWLDYEYDFEYDYKRPPVAQMITTKSLSSSPIHLVIYGPAINPYVIAGGNRYQVNTTVPAGSYLVVDGKEKTITLIGLDGSVTNAFADGLRGSGIGGGEYIFEPVPAGDVAVAWDNSFGFDFGWYAEESEPPWSQS